MDLLNLFVTLGFKDEASAPAVSAAGALKDKLAGAGKLAAAGLGAAVAAGAAAATAFAAAAGKTAEYGDNIDKASQKLGISAEAYQEWNFIAQHSGTSMDALKGSFKTLQKSAVEGSDAFQKLGISEKQVAEMSTEELFSSVIAGLQDMEEGAERTALASELLGKGAMELGPLFNTSAEDTAAMRQQIHELGGVMSDEAVKAAASYQDALQNLQTTINGAGASITAEFLPSMTKVMEGITAIFSGSEGTEAITEGIEGFCDTIMEQVPKVIETGGKLIMSLADALIKNLPKILETGISIIVQLAVGIAQAIPQLIAKIPEIVNAIIEGLKASWPTIKQGGSDIITALVEGVSALLNIVTDAGGKIIETIANAISSKLSDVVNKGREIIDSVRNGIMEKVNEARQWGADLISNFINGIKEAAGRLGSVVSEVAGNIAGFFHHSVPKYGPFRDELTWMPDFMSNMAHGIEDNAYLVQDALDKSFDFGGAEYDVSVNGSQGATLGRLLALAEEYLPRLGESSIVLDTGALVGQTVGHFDRALGNLQKQKQRGYALT